MASCLSIPGPYGFFPVGNTAPVSLTRDLPPDGPANILLLPSGDPRNVLYTVFCEKTNPLRKKLDFTCCDHDPGILARNVLLLTMIMDGVADQTMWNIFFHIRLDIDSRSTLVSQSQKLAAYDSMDSWRSSPYGAIIKIGTDHTLSELRRHWELYVDFYHPSKLPRLRELQAIFDNKCEHIVATIPKDHINPTVAAGPLYAQSRTSGLFIKHHRLYWETGTTFTDKPSIAASTHLNSTFFYSGAGEGFHVAPNTDPMIPFHHAPLFGNANRTLTLVDLVESARSQFHAWTSALRITTTNEKDSTLRVIVRFVLGDVLAVARCLRDFGENPSVQAQPHVPHKVAPWTTRVLELNREEYGTFRAPTRFDVIDTSNVSDYLGLLNIFLATAPLLVTSSSSVLYTESIMVLAPNLRTEFEVTMFASLSAVAILMDLAPANALSGFTSSSNTHEDIVTFVLSKDKDVHNHKFTWKRPRSGDPSACLHGGGHRTPMWFDTPQLIKLLHNIYVNTFKHDDPSHPHWKTLETMAPEDLKREVQRYSLLCSSREAFVIFLESIRSSIPMSQNQWHDVMRSFLDSPHFIQGYTELHAQLFRYGLFTFPGGGSGLERIYRPLGGRLSHWKSLPFLTRVFVLVPRAKVTRLENIVPAIGLQAVWLLGCIKTPNKTHIFHSLDAAYGTIIDKGTAAHPDVSVCEDPDGRKNGADVVVSFIVLTVILGMLTKTPPGDVFVELRIRNDPMVAAIPALESSRSVFLVCLEDTEYVHLMPEQPLRPRLATQKTTETVQPQGLTDTVAIEAIGREQPVRVDIDDEGLHVVSLAAKLEITNTTVQTIFADGVMPTVSQCSPCTIQIVLGGRTQTLVYPLPIVGSQRKLRLARKSSYIEVVVPVAMPFLKPDGLKMNPFPVVRANGPGSLFPWSFHRVVLDQLPVLDIDRIDAARLKEWYEFHLAFQLSQRECNVAIAPAHSDVLANVKNHITYIMQLAVGIGCKEPSRSFRLLLNTGSVMLLDTILLVDKVRFDVAAHTMVCDAFVVTLSPASPSPVSDALPDVTRQPWVPIFVQNEATVRAWKQMLAALAERCRTSWTHGANCEYAAQGRIPLDDRIMTEPLCSCGQGKDVEGMMRDRTWRRLAPYATRIALSPLFPVSYLEEVFWPEELQGTRVPGTVTMAHPPPPPSHANGYESNGNGWAAVAQAVRAEPEAACERCKKKETAELKLSRCSGCKKIAYCSRECQKSDWKAHKPQCNN